ncbi:hypothetical protein [Tichowtungia aerotolerans]|uniref:Uncharacterized protein n=1 Tax=Tichowtungia aerotolerans TaxID=2697043 RepID=A0A6P1MA88_9BACT|nr:hypothetical protein [Tichowtungia aerotolerans]QHI70003.1 hypothetical protein GT409_11275 [Tichowtungia aerotolerans]
MGLFANSKRNMVVSIDAILQSKGIRGRAVPRQQLQVLRSLSRLVQREKLNVTAVIAGKPLNKAPNNKKFDGVRVRYVKDESKTEAELIRSLKHAGSAGVLVTENVELETKVLRGGKDTLRTSTFRKLLDDGGDEGGRQDGGNRDRSNNGGRKNRRERNNNRSERKKQRPSKEKAPKKEQDKEQDEISQMIDLVD